MSLVFWLVLGLERARSTPRNHDDISSSVRFSPSEAAKIISPREYSPRPATAESIDDRGLADTPSAIPICNRNHKDGIDLYRQFFCGSYLREQPIIGLRVGNVQLSGMSGFRQKYDPLVILHSKMLIKQLNGRLPFIIGSIEVPAVHTTPTNSNFCGRGFTNILYRVRDIYIGWGAAWPYSVVFEGHTRKVDLYINPRPIPGLQSIPREGVGFPGTLKRSSSLGYSSEQAENAEGTDPKTPLCPKCAIFSSVSRAPLGAKLAFAAAFWIPAWFAILEGFGAGFVSRGGIKAKWLVGGVAIGLVPLFLGI